MTITILPNTFYHYALKLQHLLLMYTLYILKLKKPGICCQVFTALFLIWVYPDTPRQKPLPMDQPCNGLKSFQ